MNSNSYSYRAKDIQLKVFFLYTSILIPSFNFVLKGNAGFQFVFLFNFILALIITFALRRDFEISKTPFLIFLYFLVSISFSLFQDALSGVFTTNDGFEIIRVFYVYLVYLLFCTDYSRRDEEIFIRGFKTLFVLLVFLTIIEQINFVERLFYLLYKRESKEVLTGKSTGVFGITYHNAYVLLIPYFYFLLKTNVSFKIRNILFLVFSFLAIAFTQSRTLLITAVLISLLVPFLPVSRYFRRGRLLFLIALIAILTISIVIYFWDVIIQMFSYIYFGLRGLVNNGIDFSGQGSGSANIRVAQVIWALENQHFIPIFGAGVGKSEIMLESFYAMYYYRYGLIGFLIGMYIIFVGVRNSFFMVKAHVKNIDFKCFYGSVGLFFLASPIALISSAAQDSQKVAVIFYGAIALLVKVKGNYTCSQR